ncbi:hypothetical protein ACO22_07394 [Paracoccidioides brasiliensis]|uniref:Uncharacterized protein n=1 Tax=Paracoccidioides brasiliensis TaxID=121759 RepID=A0A1D2J4X1_PARBR|nr:hypothetical protein ACO22_07394 [Paracoccidioides brasiliensis]
MQRINVFPVQETLLQYPCFFSIDSARDCSSEVLSAVRRWKLVGSISGRS